jgi:Xaa-Pro aminopeptidase
MDSKEFVRRRRQFMRMIGRDAIAILPAAPVRHRNGEIEYAYRQDSHFHYLTGFPEPEAVAVFVPGRPHAEYLLFVRERDLLRESWDGPRAGTDGAVAQYGADDAFPVGDIDEILPGLIELVVAAHGVVDLRPLFDQPREYLVDVADRKGIVGAVLCDRPSRAGSTGCARARGSGRRLHASSSP